ncbi:MAG: nucleotidyltransferase domain-containing protein [Phycisphaerales bacterium]
MVDTGLQSEGQGVDAAVDAVRPIVHQRLRAVERERNLRVVFACESGSRAWGFASDDSDFDVRFIFVRPPECYLQLNPPVDAFDLHGGDDFDLAGWDIRKAAELMRKSNSPLLEWLDSPIIYERDRDVSSLLIELRDRYFDPKKSVYHYLSLAGGVWGKYIADNPSPVRKKYLYTIRPLACVRYIETHGTQPPTRFESVLEQIELDSDTEEAIAGLVADKKANRELGEGRADAVLNKWISETLERGERLAESLSPSSVTNEELDSMIATAILGGHVLHGETT